MDFKTFTSDDNHFTINTPIEWEEYDDEKDTYVFFNAISWTGNLRITPFSFSYETNYNDNKALELINEELADNEGAIKMKLNKFDCVHYKKAIEQDNEQLVIYYWIIGRKNDAFICSFAIDKNQEETKQNEQELQTVQNILRSIKMI